MGSLRLILGLVAAIAVVGFGVKNMQMVTVQYYQSGSYTLPLFYLLVGFFAVGFLVAWLAGLLDRLQFYRKIRFFRRKVRTLESEVENVRAQSGRLLASGESAAVSGANDSLSSSPSLPEPSTPAPGPGAVQKGGGDADAR